MKAKIKSILNTTANVLSLIFGYGIMLSLFVGGLSFFAYLVALIIGGDVAARICTVIYKGVYPYLVYVTSLFVLLGLLVMYLRGETALSATKKKKKEVEKEDSATLEATADTNEAVPGEGKTNTATKNDSLVLESSPILEDKKTTLDVNNKENGW